MILSVPVHQSLEVIPHFLTNFAVDRNHVSTIMSEVEILSSHASDLCRTAQNFVCTSKSSIQRSEQSVSVVSWELPSSPVRNPFTTCRPIESSISCSLWTKVQWECVHCSSCVQVHLHPFKPLRTTGGTKIQTSREKMSLRNCHTFVPHLHHSTHRNSAHRSFRHQSNHRSKKCQWYMSVQIPECPSLPPMNFQDMRDQLSMFCPCVSLWHLGSHFGSIGFSFGFALVLFTLTFALTLGP